MESGTENSLPKSCAPGLAADRRQSLVEEERHESAAASTERAGPAMVKRWGKSPPRTWQQGRHAKPHPEQDQIGER